MNQFVQNFSSFPSQWEQLERSWLCLLHLHLDELSFVFALAGRNSQANKREKEEAEKCSLLISFCVNK